jgi:hypothetical protein
MNITSGLRQIANMPDSLTDKVKGATKEFSCDLKQIKDPTHFCDSMADKNDQELSEYTLRRTLAVGLLMTEDANETVLDKGLNMIKESKNTTPQAKTVAEFGLKQLDSVPKSHVVESINFIEPDESVGKSLARAIQHLENDGVSGLQGVFEGFGIIADHSGTDEKEKGLAKLGENLLDTTPLVFTERKFDNSFVAKTVTDEIMNSDDKPLTQSIANVTIDVLEHENNKHNAGESILAGIADTGFNAIRENPGASPDETSLAKAGLKEKDVDKKIEILRYETLQGELPIDER